MIIAPTIQMAGVYRRRIGEIVVATLNDGYIDADPAALPNIGREEAEKLLNARFRPPRPKITVNAFAVHAAGRVALIETGAGATLGPTLGRLAENLVVAGIAASEIDTVLLTHMHPDHSNGPTDPSGAAVFGNATLRLHEREVAYWLDDAAGAKTTERARWYFETARVQLPPTAIVSRPSGAARCSLALRRCRSRDIRPAIPPTSSIRVASH